MLRLGHLACSHRGAHLEADDDSVARFGQQHVVLGDLSHSLVDDVDLNLVGRQLEQRVAEGLD